MLCSLLSNGTRAPPSKMCVPFCITATGSKEFSAFLCTEFIAQCSGRDLGWLRGLNIIRNILNKSTFFNTELKKNNYMQSYAITYIMWQLCCYTVMHCCQPLYSILYITALKCTISYFMELRQQTTSWIKRLLNG